ncbi:D-aminoacyl-tRNA deacylase [Bifidobacterium xylocopae]|uniref:D-aminoacyl-tRNA deacylase n=1 Tax=Bifidobacterium xylocopae TaxID=2493119 RepID=A0A366KC62_9BIFI|nr:D-aminoacyl-tRNA deacylase [Bifidobacterium xylocopae]RBP99159.1 D-tyrosyl-tRNA(Tyr) deacylase [Bifidobacterium xylocopae]
MRIIMQKVSHADVDVVDDGTGRPDPTFEPRTIDAGLVLLVGVADSDGDAQVEYAARKVANMRIFEDEAGKMNRSVLDVGGQVVSISQFTLLADIRKGNRPSFAGSGNPAHAKAVWDRFNKALARHGVKVKTGRFRSHMRVSLTNDGPVTIALDTDQLMTAK